MNFLFCGGGTGGHISPALAISEGLRKKYPNCNIAFVGRRGGKENELITREKYPLYEINIRGLSRSLSPENIKALRDALNAKAEASGIISDFKPNLVIGTGGYVCWPVITAAQKLKIPTVIHESNSVFGLTSRLLAKKCDMVLLGTDIKTAYKNAYFCGNPLRGNFGSVPREEAKRRLGIPGDKKLILSVGGSIGAKMLNDTCIDFMKSCAAANRDLIHLHAAGHRYYDEIKKAHPELCEKKYGSRIVPFIDDMATALSAADVVITRCGAMTLSEIAASGTPAILVPSPNVTGNHQLKNARAVEARGGGILIEENELSLSLLTDSVNLIIRDEKKSKSMKYAQKSLAAPDACQRILELIEKKIEL